MGYSSYGRIRALLEPLRLYDFEREGISSAELQAAADAIDDFADALGRLSLELSPTTAGEDGISMYEDLLDLHPPGDLEARRRGVLALLSSDGKASAAALTKLLAACGIAVNVREVSVDNQTIEISFPGVAGVPADFDRIQAIIERMLPCHLAVNYAFSFITWRLFERYFPKWSDLENSGYSWQELELIIK